MACSLETWKTLIDSEMGSSNWKKKKPRKISWNIVTFESPRPFYGRFFYISTEEKQKKRRVMHSLLDLMVKWFACRQWPPRKRRFSTRKVAETFLERVAITEASSWKRRVRHCRTLFFLFLGWFFILFYGDLWSYWIRKLLGESAATTATTMETICRRSPVPFDYQRPQRVWRIDCFLFYFFFSVPTTPLPRIKRPHQPAGQQNKAP